MLSIPYSGNQIYNILELGTRLRGLSAAKRQQRNGKVFDFSWKLQPIKTHKSIIVISASYQAGIAFSGIRDLLKGKVGDKMELGRGDFVRFPKGLSCIWDIKEAVKKHYNFR
jgi:hypothetical protein